MRIIYALSLILLLTPNVMAAEEINFSFSCKVLDQQILEVMDGKSSRYSGYKGGGSIGDTFKLSFSYDESLDGSYALAIRTDHEDVVLGSFISDGGLVSQIGDWNGFEWKDSSDDIQLISQDILNIEGIGGALITGRRYYKDDWNLLLRNGLFDDVFIQTANCMNVPDELGIMLEKIRIFHK